MKKLLLILLMCPLIQGAIVEKSVSLNRFNAGELSPLMNSRSDFAKYIAGAKTLENMLVLSQGPVTRRPGTKYIATVKDSTDATRIIPFEYSTSDTYIIEMGDAYLRFYRNGGQILSGASAYEIVSPYDPNDLFEIQFTQDAEVMRLVHPDYQPRTLTRTGHAAWTLTAIEFEGGPFLDENETTTTTLTADALTGAGVNLTASAAVFDDDHVGAIFQITHTIEANSVTGYFWADGFTEKFYDWGNTAAGHVSTPNTPSITVQEGREYSFSTHGQWYGTIKAQRSYDDGSTWEDATPAQAYNGDGNMQWTGREDEDDAIYRLQFEITEAVAQECHINLSAHQFLNNGVIEITTVTNSTTAVGTVRTDYDIGDTTATYRWSEGAWSDYRGWPRTVCHHEQRCVYGGSTSYPQMVWASVIADTDTEYNEFTEGDTDDDAWLYNLPGMNPIQWMRSGEFLMIGSTSSIGSLGQPGKPITPTWPPIYRMQAKNGSDYIQAVDAVDAILFVERGGQKVREITYTYASDKYIADDMTVLAEHITGDGIVEIDFQNRPNPILWCVRDNGELLSFTYNRRHDVMAWTRSDTGATGLFESVAIIPGTDEDELWTVVNRTVDSSTVRYVEQFQPVDWGSDQNDCWFVDSAVTDITNLSHLEGETVALFADGRPISTYTVSGGVISPASSYTNHIVGLPYTSVFETMPLTSSFRQGSSASKYTRIMDMTLDVYKTLGCHIGRDSTNLSDLQFSEDSFATTLDVVTDNAKYVPFPRNSTRNPVIYINEADPVPLTIRGINAKMEVTFD